MTTDDAIIRSRREDVHPAAYRALTSRGLVKHVPHDIVNRQMQLTPTGRHITRQLEADR